MVDEKKESPSYYAIIPADVRYNSNLKANEKLMYGEITVLSNKFGYCIAKNKYFADLYGVSISTVSRWIANLERCGYVSSVVIRDDKTNQVTERRVYLKRSVGSMQKDQEGLCEKRKDNSTSNNNTSTNKDSATSVAYISNEQIEEIANIWNSIIGTPNIRTIKKQSSRFKALNARFKEYDYDTIVEVLCKVRDSQFLTGSNNRAWSADFDWVMKPKNFLKILEDNYINKEINNEINQNNHGQSNLSRFQRTAINISREVDAGRAIIDNTPDDWVY